MATVQDTINQALRKLGVLAEGETPSAAMSADALVALNNLMDQWATERLAIYSVVRTTWAIVAAQASYTVGTGGDVAIARPVEIDAIKYQDTTGTDTEYSLGRLTDAGYRAVVQKDATATLPSTYYYNPTYATGTLYLFPVPTSATLEGVIYVPTAVTEFALTTTTVALPPGYKQFLSTNLALDLAPEYNRQVHPALVRAAQESKETVQRANFRMMDLSVDAGALQGGGGSYSIYTDQ